MVSPQNKLDLQAIFIVPLRQFTWWFIMVLLITFAGYPGVVCVTPMAWLIALRVGNIVALRSRSEVSSHRLWEASLAGGFFGLLQGVLFAIIITRFEYVTPDEQARATILTIGMVVVGIFICAVLSFIMAYFKEQQLKRTTS